jgi:hypothetical protein
LKMPIALSAPMLFATIACLLALVALEGSL